MDRLTTHEPNRRLVACRANCESWDAIYDRLAAYEDTGLEPEEVLEIAWRAEAVAAMNDHLMSQPNRYEQAESEGRLIVPPEWISVDYNNPETLPCTEKSILYCAFGRSVGEGYYRGFDGVHHVWKMYAVAGTHWDYEVTHWMPLPEVPECD